MYIYVYFQLHTCMLCFSRAFPLVKRWNDLFHLFLQQLLQPALRFGHRPCLLIVADVLRGEGKTSSKITANHEVERRFLEKTEMNTMRFFWESWRTWPMTSFKVQVLGNFISQNRCSSSEKLQFLYDCMMSGCGKPPQMSISHSLCIANMSW